MPCGAARRAAGRGGGAAAAAAAGLLALAAAAACVPGASGVVRHVSGRVSGASTDLLSNTAVTNYVDWSRDEQSFFGWNPAGEARLTLELVREDGAAAEGNGTDRMPLHVLVVAVQDKGGAEELAASYGTGRCAGTAFRRFEVYDSLDVTLSGEVVEQYTVLLLDCNRVRPRVEGRVEFRTAEGGHLGVEERLLPAVHATVAVMYAALLAAWAALCWWHRADTNRVQLAIGIAFALRLVDAAVESSFHSARDANGVVTESMADGRRAAEDLSDAWGLFTLLLLSSGYATVRARVTPREKTVARCLFAAYFAFSVATLACTAEWFCNVSAILKVVVLSFLLVAVVVLLNVAILALRAELPDTRWQAGAALLYLKYRVFLRFRVQLIVLLLLPTFALAVRFTLLTWREDWAHSLILRAGILLVEALIAFPFRPQKGNPLFLFPNAAAE